MAKVHVLVGKDNVSDLDSGSEADVESEEISDVNENNSGDDLGVKKSGMADAMAKILGKQIPSKKGIILAKGMTDKQIERKRKIKEQGGKIDETGEKKIHMDQITKQAKKKEWNNRGRIKPNPLEKPAERTLQRIATRGIVQLFNAVRKQQKLLDDQLIEAGSSVRRSDKVVESMTKGKFLDILKGTAPKSTDSKSKQRKLDIKKPKKGEENDEEVNESKWSILRDDFMMGATMKDWDKENSDGEESPDD